MAIKFLACTVRSSNPSFADTIVSRWHEYEDGKTPAAILVRQLDKLECIQQAVLYSRRDGIIVDDFMELKEKVTLPALQPLLNECLRKHESVVRNEDRDFFIFVIGEICRALWLSLLIIVIGGPGVGKGTQCSRLVKEFQEFSHISVGDMLREEANDPKSPYKDFIHESMQKSVLIPAQLTTKLLSQKFDNAVHSGHRKFLLDGFPRSLSQIRDFEAKVGLRHKSLNLV
jgi:hypothetical protein